MKLFFQRLLILYFIVALPVSIYSCSVFSTELNDLTYITESHASFNYIRDGKLQGPAVDLLLAASVFAGSPIEREDILVQPWSRGFKNAQKGPNVVLFSTIRTPKREKKFQWVGPIASESDVLISLKARQLQINKPEDMTAYITGAVRGDVGEEILQDVGVPLHKIVLISLSNNLGKMLSAGRIDIWIFGEDGWRESLISADLDPDKFEIIYRFPPKRYYFSFSLDIEQRLVEELQQAVDKVFISNESTF